MADTCRHGRPFSVTCDFCRVESRSSESIDRPIPPRWRVPRWRDGAKFSAPKCQFCPYPPKDWEDVYNHLQQHISEELDGKLLISEEEKVGLQALFESFSRSEEKVQANPSTTIKTIGPEHTPTKQPSREWSSRHHFQGMSAREIDYERKRALTRKIKALTPMIITLGTLSLLQVLLGVLVIIPISSYDLAVTAYSLIYPISPNNAANFLEWWQRWSIVLGGYLALSGTASVFYLAYRQRRKSG